MWGKKSSDSALLPRVKSGAERESYRGGKASFQKLIARASWQDSLAPKTREQLPHRAENGACAEHARSETASFTTRKKAPKISSPVSIGTINRLKTLRGLQATRSKLKRGTTWFNDSRVQGELRLPPAAKGSRRTNVFKNDRPQIVVVSAWPQRGRPQRMK